MRDNKAFRERFQRWKSGQKVYDAGKPIEHYGDGREGLTQQNDATRVVNIRQQVAEINEQLRRQMQAAAMVNTAQIGPNQNVPQALQDQYRREDETRRWAQQKAALEDATDEMMKSFLDPRYYIAGNLIGGAFKGIGAVISAANKFRKAYKVSRAINKTVKNANFGKAMEVPGQVGWAPKTKFTGYHASNEAELSPDFWYKNWAIKEHGAAPGFYMAEGNAPEGGFLADRPYVYRTEVQFDKPMVQVGDIPAASGMKNATRNVIEQQAKELGADGIIYQDIKDNQLAHQTIAKTLNPDVELSVSRQRYLPNDAKQLEQAQQVLLKSNPRRTGKSVGQNVNGIVEVEPKQYKYSNSTFLPEVIGSDKFVDSEGTVNIRNVVKAIRDFYKQHPNAKNYKDIINSSGNLFKHISDVVTSAQHAPIPKGFTRQDLVKAALFHDIGKVLDQSYSGHPQKSIEIMKELGINDSPAIEHAIAQHMKGSNIHNMGERGSIGMEDSLTRALHFVDVVRNTAPMSNEGAYDLYRNLLYPQQVPYKIRPLYSWDTDWQLENIINPILRRYGYFKEGEGIPLGLSPEDARKEVLDYVRAHRRFVRGQHDFNSENNIAAIHQFVKREGRYPTKEELFRQGFEYLKEHNTSSGDRGMREYQWKFELPRHKTMSLYTSNSDMIPGTYARSTTDDYAIRALEMPVMDNPDWSLAELWGYNDYPLVYSPGGSVPIWNSNWRYKELPQILNFGKGNTYLSAEDAHRINVQREIIAHDKALQAAEDYIEKQVQSGKLKAPQFSDTPETIYKSATAPLKVTFSPKLRNDDMPFYEAPFPPMAPDVLWNSVKETYIEPRLSQFSGKGASGYKSLLDRFNSSTLSKAVNEINEFLAQYGISKIIPYSYSTLPEKVNGQTKLPETILKHPKALIDLYHEIQRLKAEVDVPAHIRELSNHVNHRAGVLKPPRQFRNMTSKQIQAHNNSNKIRTTEEGLTVNTPIFIDDSYFGEFVATNTKYVPDMKKLVKKAVDKYFRDIKQANSKDAYIRRQFFLPEQMRDFIGAEGSKIKDKFYIKPAKVYPSEGVEKIDYPFETTSFDGYRVFVTEHGHGPGTRSVENFVIVGPRGAKVATINDNIKFDINNHGYTRGQDRIGNQKKGLTKNAR